MKKVLQRRPSASMVVAVLALVMGASGTAVAAGSLVSGDKLIKKHSLSGNRLKNHTITGTQIKMSKLGTVPKANDANFATTAGSATSATNATNATTAGSAPIAKVTYATNADTSSFNNTTGVPVTATCPSGTTVIGGGASLTNEQTGFVNDSYPNGRTGWTADIFNSSGTITATVTAICAPAAATAP